MTPSDDIESRLSAIEARVEKATDGEWRWDTRTAEIVSHPTPESRSALRAAIWGPNYGPSPADGNFIAHARSDIPFLIEQLRLSRREALEEAAIREAFAAADDKDWTRLDQILGYSAHGKFWRGVLNKVRALISSKDTRDG